MLGKTSAVFLLNWFLIKNACTPSTLGQRKSIALSSVIQYIREKKVDDEITYHN